MPDTTTTRTGAVSYAAHAFTATVPHTPPGEAFPIGGELPPTGRLHGLLVDVPQFWTVDRVILRDGNQADVQVWKVPPNRFGEPYVLSVLGGPLPNRNSSHVYTVGVLLRVLPGVAGKSGPVRVAAFGSDD